MTVTDDFLATLAGAAVAGAIGIATLLVQQQLDFRRRLDEEILAPGFSFLVGFPTSCPWASIPEAPWSSLDPYRWLRIPARYRLPLRVMSDRVDTYNAAWERYFRFMGEFGWQSFGADIRNALAKYFVSENNAFSARSVGIDTGGFVQLQWIAAAIPQFVLLNPRLPEEAWDQLVKSGPSSFSWAQQMTESLRRIDPAALQRIFDAISGNALAPKAKELSSDLLECHGSALTQARVVRKILAKRLRVTDQG